MSRRLFRNQPQSVDILKTDIEGYHLEILRGAEFLLARNKISLVFSEAGFDREDRQHTNFCDLLALRHDRKTGADLLQAAAETWSGHGK